MNKVRNYLAIAAFAIMVMGLPAIASAQNRNRDRDDDRYGNNGGYGNGGYYGNGQYGNSGYYGDTRSAIRSLKSHTRDFQRQLDRDLDRSRLNGTRREDQINEVARRFRDAVNDLDNNGYYGNGGGYGNYGGYGRNDDRYRRDDQKIRRVYDLASQIERSIGRAQISYQTRNYWSMVRNDLQALSRGYTYDNGRGNGNGGWGNGRSGGGRAGLPSWWPF